VLAAKITTYSYWIGKDHVVTVIVYLPNPVIPPELCYRYLGMFPEVGIGILKVAAIDQFPFSFFIAIFYYP
jgi:hypothetical protein